jgi:hypothetical protein
LEDDEQESALVGSGSGTFLAAVVLILGGCPTESPVKPAGLEQKI